MNKELDKQLCESYPEIFHERLYRNGDKRMCWGFECGDGWYHIIDGLCKLIENQRYHNELNKKEMSPVVALQVKEKYGTLRFYYSGGDEYIDGAVSMAERMSAVTCEACGKPGTIRGGSWIRTLCDEHAAERGVE